MLYPSTTANFVLFIFCIKLFWIGFPCKTTWNPLYYIMDFVYSRQTNKCGGMSGER